ncbi:MAG: transporter substrate-binding domain-containing protein [Lachnospiraceae bacterium]
MKKLVSMFLMLAMVMSLCACGAKETSSNDTQAADGNAQTTAAGEETKNGAAGDDLADVTAKGKMVIGITVYEPMNYYDANNKLVGFDTEYAEAVCAKLGVTPEFVEINWDTKVVELDSKNIDCIWNGMTITEELKENIDFSAPYIKNMQVVVVKKENAEKYKDTAALSSCSVAAEAGSAGESAIKDDANLSKATYVSVAKQTDALMEVKAGTSDAAVLDYVMAAAMVGEGTDYADLCMVEGVELSVEEYGIGFRKNSTLTEKVDAVTDELIADGTLAKIAEKYDLTLQLISNQK